jgi:LysR family cyn operon transcriptional activator
MLQTLKLVLFDRSFATRVLLDRHFAVHRIQPKISVESNSVETLISLVRCGGFATILPGLMGSGIAGTRSVPLSPPILTRRICILKRADAYHSFASIAFEQTFTSAEWAFPTALKTVSGAANPDP